MCVDVDVEEQESQTSKKLDPPSFSAPPHKPLPGDAVRLRTAAGDTIVAAYVPPPPGGTGLLLVAHGTASDLGTTVRFYAAVAADAGCALLAYDYPGYGASSGTPSVAGANAAGVAAFDHAVSTRGHAAEEVVLYGQSIGSGPTLHVASTLPAASAIAGVALHAAFAGIVGNAAGVGWWPASLEAWPNAARVEKLSCPVLVAHGERDVIVPVAHARALAAAAGGRAVTFYPPDAGHDDVQVAGGYHTAVQRFVRRCVADG